MKMRHGIILTVLLAAFSTAAEETYHTFTNAQGRTMEARLIRYNEADNTATIHPRGRAATTVPISIFSDETRSWIINWSHRQALLDEQMLRIDISHVEKLDRDIVRRDDHGTKQRFYHFFAITMQNQSTVDLEHLTIEYVIFYQQEKHIRGEEWNKERLDGTLYSRQSISIPHKSEIDFATDSILLAKYQVDGTSDPATSAKVNLDHEVDGIIFRVSMQTSDGDTILREVTYPGDLEKKWTSRTRNVQGG